MAADWANVAGDVYYYVGIGWNSFRQCYMLLLFQLLVILILTCPLKNGIDHSIFPGSLNSGVIWLLYENKWESYFFCVVPPAMGGEGNSYMGHTVGCSRMTVRCGRTKLATVLFWCVENSKARR